jgi:hypothetical protein
MIHVLVAGPEGGLPAGMVSSRSRSSVEVLLARGAEEAVDRLARNRRVDAVLLLAGAENEAIAAAIREDSLAPPPLYLPASAADLAGARRLSSDSPEELLDLVAEALASD